MVFSDSEQGLGNTMTNASWPKHAIGTAGYGEVYLSGGTPVDYFPTGMEAPTLAASLFMATTGVAMFKKFSERKSKLSSPSAKRKQKLE